MSFDAMSAAPAGFLDEIRTARAELEAEFAGLTDAEMEEPGMTGVWNGRMTLVHIARWDETAAHMVLRDRHGSTSAVRTSSAKPWLTCRKGVRGRCASSVDAVARW